MKKITKALIHRAAVICRKRERLCPVCDTKVCVYALFQVENDITEDLKHCEIDYSSRDALRESLYSIAIHGCGADFEKAVWGGDYFEWDMDRAKHYLTERDFKTYKRYADANKDDPFDIYRIQAKALEAAFRKIWDQILIEL